MIIKIDENTRGIIVYAQSTKVEYTDWLLLISHTQESEYPTNDLTIYTHLSICYRGHKSHRIGLEPWGRVKRDGFIFHTPTEEQVNEIKRILKEENKKFVKVINQVIDR